ncbi:MerR family transcriptional regulator [Streptomyces luteireticuli]|uniref:MerR family transcriptional regulator n=1 Tax=Streptomyces luteireticuli TaxID=173858 RepID=A0ABN0YX47_9ACTN
MNDTAQELMSIGAFARRVGLTPSALRFYDDCGVLRPAAVDGATGYRSYAPAQEARAVLVRRLREAGLPLTDTAVVLDGAPEEARAVLEEHARRAGETADAARSVIGGILDGLPGAATTTTARVDGAELAGAVRQVASAAATGAAREEFPVLGGILLELGGQEVRLVATDRYRLAVRALWPDAACGPSRRIVVDAHEMREIAAWALRLPEVVIEADEQGARLRGGGEERAVAAAGGTFPDYRLVLDDRPALRHRVITDRSALRTALAESGGTGPVTLRTAGRHLALDCRDAEGAGLPAVCVGEPPCLAFDPELLIAALDAGVGPDVLMEIEAPDRPVVIRSADQGSFTTLAMPVLVPEAARPPAEGKRLALRGRRM